MVKSSNIICDFYIHVILLGSATSGWWVCIVCEGDKNSDW